MGYHNAVSEYVTPGGLFSVDIFLKHHGVPVAIEVDGPFHYATNEPRKALGAWRGGEEGGVSYVVVLFALFS